MGTGSSDTGSSYGSSDSSASSASDKTAAGNSLQGKVEKFDRSKNTLTLSGVDKTLKLDSSTKVMKDGSSATLDDIKEGDQVRASFSGSGNTVKAKSLDIMTAGSMGSTGSSGSSGMGGSPSGSGTGASGAAGAGSGTGASGSSGSSGSDTSGTTK